MSKQELIAKVATVLEATESAPSAHILVKSFITPVLDTEADEIYNLSEGYNDQQTMSILSTMPDQNLQELITFLKEHAEVDPEDEHISEILSSL